jgi:hypothetical protein
MGYSKVGLSITSRLTRIIEKETRTIKTYFSAVNERKAA